MALGSPLAADRFELAERTIAQLGFSTHYTLHPGTYYGKLQNGFANGSAAERVQAFYELLENPKVDVILTARGGYGVLDTFPGLDFKKISKARKAIIGMSDTTALLAQAGAALGIPAIHGATAGDAFANYAEQDSAKRSVEALIALLSDPAWRLTAECEAVRSGSGTGRILAGNLTMLTSLLGTPWQPDFRNKILVVEEVGESPFRIHRLFTQLKLAGVLPVLAGLVLGRFSKCESKQGPSVDDVFEMLLSDILRGTTYPVLKGLPFGHWGENLPLPLFCTAEIRDQQFRVVESPLE